MVRTSFEAAIDRLERANGGPDSVSNEAARIVGADLEENIERCNVEVRYRSSPLSHGFKEQWLLRWLLKKLTISDFKASGKTLEDLGSRYARPFPNVGITGC